MLSLRPPMSKLKNLKESLLTELRYGRWQVRECRCVRYSIIPNFEIGRRVAWRFGSEDVQGWVHDIFYYCTFCNDTGWIFYRDCEIWKHDGISIA